MSRFISPPRPKSGDLVRVIAPSRSMDIVPAANRLRAKTQLEALGLRVTYGEYVEQVQQFGSGSIEHRLIDLHDAINDPEVKVVLCALGGYNSNHLIDKIDYASFKENPKIVCGYSDSTALLNAIATATGYITYLGPLFASFAMPRGIDFLSSMFWRCISDSEPFTIDAPTEWSDDKWWCAGEGLTYHSDTLPTVIQPGDAEGTVLGGNLSTFALLQGTSFFPVVSDPLLVLEDDALVSAEIFDRYLQSLIHCLNGVSPRGVLIGRFERGSRISLEVLREIVGGQEELSGVPVVCDVCFGHTIPLATIPLGGRIRISASTTKATITVLAH